MTDITEIAGPYIVWDNYGSEGWQPKSYPTLKDAVCAERYGHEFVVTRLVVFDVTERVNDDVRERPEPAG